ncbi:hypothetical protein AJ79_01987 [Helicocarpus griseus UAMH5409]|uniref:BTB domain-containing protein n=1 Tax=Helicocarpus griseus UAMH5409 TaxID=1447875 RepID=A0A2B7Y5S8_9EURO|nr:hypothetical protein AJ79_01987 [Helicocarpus griseus UAMH5409]
MASTPSFGGSSALGPSNPPRASLFSSITPNSAASTKPAQASYYGYHGSNEIVDNVSLSPSNETKVEFLKGFASLFNSATHSDVTLYLGPQKIQFHAHYVILSARTAYFDKAKKGGFEESKNNEFLLVEHNSHALYRMLQYIYTGDYSSEKYNLDQNSDDGCFLKHTRVYILADYFDVKGLKALCTHKFSKQAGGIWSNASLIEAISSIYSAPKCATEDMRKEILNVLREHIERLHEEQGFRDLLNRYAEFGADVVDLLLKKYYKKPIASLFGSTSS